MEGTSFLRARHFYWYCRYGSYWYSTVQAVCCCFSDACEAQFIQRATAAKIIGKNPTGLFYHTFMYFDHITVEITIILNLLHGTRTY